MSDVIIGDMIGFSKIATGTPAAFAREVHGGQMSYETNPIVIHGVGAQRITRKGMSSIRTSVQCTGVAKADWNLWIPGELDLSIDTMFDCLAEVDDGSNGQEFVLTGGEPARLQIEWSDAPDALVMFTLDALWALATEQAVGNDVPVYYDDTSDLIFGPGDLSVTVGGTDYGVVGVNLVIDLTTEPHNTATVRSAAAKTFPDGYVLTRIVPTVELTTSEPIVIGQLVDDEYTAADLVLTLDNGNAAAGAVITLEDMVCPDFNIPFENNGKVNFAHSFIGGNSADTWGTASVA